MSDIPLVEADEVSTRRGGKTKGEKYGKYAVAIQKHKSWIKEAINTSKDGTIRMKTTDFAIELGKDFEGRNETSLYWGLQYVMFNEGIVVKTGTHKDGSKLLQMRFATEEDRLPPSLQKYIDRDEEQSEE